MCRMWWDSGRMKPWAKRIGYALLVVALVAWALFAVLVLHPWYVREVGTW